MSSIQRSNSLADQLELFKEFQLGPVHLSRLLPSWDLLFPFLFTKTKAVPPDTKVSDIPARSYEFATPTGRIRITVSPAFMSGKGREKAQVIYAGEREELVATALRALLTRGEITPSLDDVQSGRPGDMRSAIVLAFHVRQVIKELARTAHTFSHAEVDQALEVLAKTHFSLENFIEGEESERAPSIPYYHKYLKKGDQRIIYLNDIEANQLFRGSYRAINNDLMLRLRSGLARWIYKFIHSEHRNAEKPVRDELPPPFDINYSLLIERGVIAQTSKIRDGLERVRAALDQLCEQGVLHKTKEAPRGYREQQLTAPTKGRRKIVGAIWHVYSSIEEVEQIIAEHAEAKYRGRANEGRFTTANRLSMTADARKDLAKPRLRAPERPVPGKFLPERLFPAPAPRSDQKL
jgi:hypothetical protein